MALSDASCTNGGGGGEGGGAWSLFHISKLTLPDVTTELNDTFDGAGCRLCYRWQESPAVNGKLFSIPYVHQVRRDYKSIKILE